MVSRLRRGTAIAKNLLAIYIACSIRASTHKTLQFAAYDDPIGVPIAGDDANVIAVASGLIRQIGFEPALVGGLAMGKYLLPGTPHAGEHTPAEIRQIADTLH
jgi:predicted dinucleotide-binding enzyme